MRTGIESRAFQLGLMGSNCTRAPAHTATNPCPSGRSTLSADREAQWLEDAGSNSVVDWLNTKSLKSLKVVLHGFEHFGGVPLPIGDLARDPQRLPGAV